MSESPSAASPWKRFERYVPIVLFALALGLRLIGIGWGLPDTDRFSSYHPDEPVVFGNSQQIEPSKGDFTPGFYNYGTLYLTLVRVSSDVARAYGGGGDGISGEINWMRSAQLGGRFISALAGAGTVLLAYLILRRLTNPLGAILGALLMLVAPGHVVHSRFLTVDVLAAFLLAMSLWHAIRRLDAPAEGTWRPALYAGVFAGLSAGTKYTGILALLALAVAAFSHERRFAVRDLAIGVGASVVAFILSTPGALLESDAFWRDVRYEMLHTATGHGLVFYGHTGFAFDFANLLTGLGLLGTLMGLAGLAVASWRRHRWAWALLVFCVAHFVLIGRGDVHFLRYTFPLYLPLAVGFGWIVGRGHEKAFSPGPEDNSKGKGIPAGAWRLLPALGIAAVGGIDGSGLLRATTLTGFMTSEDPRDSVARSLKGSSETVGLVSRPWFYTPPFYPEANLGPWVPWGARLEAMGAAQQPPVRFYLPANPDDAYDWDVRLLTEIKPERVVFSSFEMEDVERLQGRTGMPGPIQVQVDRYREFMEKLQTDYTLEQRHGAPALMVHDLQYIRPILWVWKRKTAN